MPDQDRSGRRVTDPDTTRRLELLEQLLRDLPRELKATYLPRETYEADQRADGVQLRGLEAEVRAMRQALAALDDDIKSEARARREAVEAERLRREEERKARDAEAATTRRLLYSSFLFPIAVAVVLAILLGGVLQ